jgi:hypothetical protein
MLPGVLEHETSSTVRSYSSPLFVLSTWQLYLEALLLLLD